MSYKDSVGRYVTVGLFKEFKRKDSDYEPVFTLDEWREVYMRHCDTTEYGPAMELLNDWQQWKLVRNHPRIKPIIDGWAEEVEIIIRSRALKNLAEIAATPNGTTAAKYIVDGGFTGRSKKSKANKEKEERIQDEMSARVKDDMRRLGLKVVEGGA